MGVEGSGLVNVFFPEDSVFSPSTLDSAQMKPVTLGHPEGFVNTENYNDVSVGHLGNDIYPFDDMLSGSVMITKKDAIESVEGGIEETSIGYYVNVIKESGDFNGVSYDYRVTGPIEINHLAIVEDGRSGKTVRIYNEKGSEMKLEELESTLEKAFEKQGTTIGTIMQNAIDTAVENAKTKASADDGDKDDASKQIQQINVEVDVEALATSIAEKSGEAVREVMSEFADQADDDVEDIDGAEDEAGDDDGTIEGTNAASVTEQVKNRMNLINKVAHLIEDPDKLVGVETDREIMDMVMEAVGEETEGKSDDYVLGRVDSLVNEKDRSNKNRSRAAAQRQAVNKKISSGSMDDIMGGIDNVHDLKAYVNNG